MKSIISCVTIIATLVASSSCAPVNEMHRSVSGTQKTLLPHPIIKYPGSAFWWAKERHNVTWNTTQLPKGQNWPNTAIILGRNKVPLSENVDMPGGERSPLAMNFSLNEGRVTIKVPDAYDGNKFNIGLFVDHGNPEDTGSWNDFLTLRNDYE